ncbi:MAG: membrane protein insertase YidC [Burkholderiales bacterium]|jgi:YidC/Oxa1 family membrane protein insertase|nr:membrane protein insertase YidC [Burkholderiales bacterium]MCE1175874.1 membrane protein insertase YidC [Burkholderiales bacterium]
MKNFNPRTILWMVFASSIFLLWSNYQQRNMSAQQAVAQQSAAQNQVAANSNGASSNTTTNSTNASSNSPISNSLNFTGVPVVLENDVLKLNINTQGGVVQFAMLKQFFNSHNKSLNTVLFNSKNANPDVISPNEMYVSRSGLTDVGLDHTTMFTADAPMAVMQDGQNSVSLTLSAQNNGITLKKTYTLHRGSYLMDVSYEVQNNSAQAIRPDVYMEIVRDGAQNGDSKFYTTYTGPVVYNATDKFKKVSFIDIAKNKPGFTEKSDIGWVGMLQHYFVSAWVVPETRERTFYTRTLQAASAPEQGIYSVGERLSLGDIAPAGKANFNAQLYVGPQDQDKLAAIAPGLDLSVDYGWLTIIAKPVHWFLNFLHSFIPNWGWAIVALTVIMKLAFFPLTAASYKSMAKMRQLAPKVKILQEQYADDKMKLNQETMALYRAEKVNPAGGCLPMLIQMPVFIALFYVLQAAVEMRGAPWVGWIQDLSLPDPYYILPVLMCLTMVFQTWLNPKPADPMQEKMMWIMPFMFAFTFFFFPSGLVLYWVVSNIFSIAQQWVVTKKYGR